jgi:hypothetical protein
MFPLIQPGYFCVNLVTKFASGMVTYCAFAGIKCKKRIKRSKERFFMRLNFKSNIRNVWSSIRNLLVDVPKVVSLCSVRKTVAFVKESRAGCARQCLGK